MRLLATRCPNQDRLAIMNAEQLPTLAYTSGMTLTLDPILEQRIQRQLERGVFREPSELLSHAMDLLEAEDAEDWLVRNKVAVSRLIEQSFERVAREGTYSPEETLRMLSARRAA
jgi:Arc/MetJ-type ribon-helix-helix transcriptional regulator